MISSYTRYSINKLNGSKIHKSLIKCHVYEGDLIVQFHCVSRKKRECLVKIRPNTHSVVHCSHETSFIIAGHVVFSVVIIYNFLSSHM